MSLSCSEAIQSVEAGSSEMMDRGSEMGSEGAVMVAVVEQAVVMVQWRWCSGDGSVAMVQW